MARLTSLPILVIVAILAISLQQTKVVALKCWECDTSFDSECGRDDKISSSMYRNCVGEMGKVPVCIRIGSLSSSSGERRQCANDLGKANSICNSARENGMDCKICDYNGCNSARSHSPIAVLIASLIAFMIIFPV